MDAAQGQSTAENPALPKLPKNFSEQMSKARNIQRPLTWEWSLAERFLAGDQSMGVARNGGMFALPAKSYGTTAAQFNLLIPFFRSKIAILDIAFPDVTVRPITPSQEDIRKSQSTRLCGEYLWDAKGVERVGKRAIAMTVRTGTSGIQTYYDQGKADSCIRAKSAYDIRFEPGAVNDDEAFWKSCRTLWKKDELLEAYPKYAEAIEQAVISTQGGQGDGRRPNFSATMEQVPRDSVEVWDVYCKNGAHGLWCGETWIDHKELPKGSDPLVIFRYEELPDRIYGQGLIWPLIDSQRLFTRIIQRAADMIEAMANPIWINPTTSGVSKNAFNNVIGGVLNYNMAGGKPERISGSEIPQTVFEMLKLIQATMQDIASSHNQSLGKRAVGVNSGRAIAELSSNDQDQMTYTEWNIAEGMKSLLKTLIIYAKDTWTGPMWTKAFTPTYGTVEYMELQSTDLVDSPDVVFEVESLFKHRIEGREQQLQQMVQNQMMSPQDAMKRSIARAWGMDSAKAMMRSFKANTIVEMVKGHLPLEVYPTDPLQEVLEQLDDYMMQPEFYAPYTDAMGKVMQAQEMQDELALQQASMEMNEAKARCDYIREFYAVTLAASQAPGQSPSGPANAPIWQGNGPPMMTQDPGNPNPQTGAMDQEQVDARQQVTEARGGQQQSPMNRGAVVV